MDASSAHMMMWSLRHRVQKGSSTGTHVAVQNCTLGGSRSKRTGNNDPWVSCQNRGGKRRSSPSIRWM